MANKPGHKMKRTGFACFAFGIILFSILSAWDAKADDMSEDSAVLSIPSEESMSASAAIVVDSHNFTIYALNPDARLPPASTTKLMTAMVALDHLKLKTRIQVGKRAARVQSDKPRLRAYDVLSVAELLHLTLMSSINSAAVALAEKTAGSEEKFVAMMNMKAKQIGAENTMFSNSSGLSHENHYTTVSDLTLILKEALTYPVIREILCKKGYLVTSFKGRRRYITNTNRLLWTSADMIGGKTGFTKNARYCFVGAFKTNDGPVFTAVLGTPSKEDLWKSTERLVWLANNRKSHKEESAPTEDPLRLSLSIQR